MEILFVIDVDDKNCALVVGRIAKGDSMYTYKPMPSSYKSKSVWVNYKFKESTLPMPISQRIFSPYNQGVDALLRKLKLSEYDEWEILKRTKGVSLKDSLKFVNKNTLENQFVNRIEISSLKEVPNPFKITAEEGQKISKNLKDTFANILVKHQELSSLVKDSTAISSIEKLKSNLSSIGMSKSILDQFASIKENLDTASRLINDNPSFKTSSQLINQFGLLKSSEYERIVKQIEPLRETVRAVSEVYSNLDVAARVRKELDMYKRIERANRNIPLEKMERAFRNAKVGRYQDTVFVKLDRGKLLIKSKGKLDSVVARRKKEN